MKQSLVIPLAISLALFAVGGGFLTAAGPSKGDAISFEPIIQDEPRIKFGKGVEESVAPTTGSLSVTIKDLTLAGRGNVPLEIKHHYDSSGVAALSDEEVDGASLSTIGFMFNLSGMKSFGGMFYSQYGVNDVVGLIKEGLIVEVLIEVVKLIKVPPGAGDAIAATLTQVFNILHLEFIDNSNIHLYLPQFTPSVTKVRGLYAPHKQIDAMQFTAVLEALVSTAIGATNQNQQDPATVWSSVANALFSIHPAKTLSVVLDDNSTVGFKIEAANELNTILVYKPSQPDNKALYNLVYDKTLGVYIFQTKDGTKYTIRPYVNPFLYVGFGDIGFKDLMNPVGGNKQPSLDDVFGKELNFLSILPGKLTDFIKLFGTPYGVVTSAKDVFGNELTVDYNRHPVMDYPVNIKQVTDSLGRATQFKHDYDYTDPLQGLTSRWELYSLREIIAPDGQKVKYEYFGNKLKPNPEKIVTTDFLGRKTTVYFKKAPWNPLAYTQDLNILGLFQNPYAFYYLSRVDYPIGGYVEYESQSLRSGSRSAYRDVDLTKEFITKRTEHTSTDPTKDQKDATTYFYDFKDQLSVIVSTSLSFKINSFEELVGKVISGESAVNAAFSINLAFVQEVLSGQTVVNYQNGLYEKYTLRKSNPGNFNHYLGSISLSAGGLLGNFLESANFQLGYLPTRFQVVGIESGSVNTELQVVTNGYNPNTWDLVYKKTTQGGVIKENTFLYDAYANPVHETGPLGSETTSEYLINDDYLNRINLKFQTGLLKKKTVKNPAGSGDQVTEFFYDEQDTRKLGRLNRSVVHNNLLLPDQVSRSTFNDQGEVVSTVDPNGTSTTFFYDYGTPASPFIQKGKFTGVFTTRFDGSSNLENIVSSQLFDRNTEFLVSETDPRGNTTGYENDSLGRVRKVSFPDLTTLTYAYADTPGDLHVDVMDAAQQKTAGAYLRYRYDGLGRLKSLTQKGPDFEYTSENFYNPEGTLSHVVDAQGRTTRLKYDARKRLSTITYPDGTSLNSSYDYLISSPDYYVQTLTDARTNRTYYIFDALDRLSKVIDADLNTTAYGYDTLGNLLYFTDARGLRTGYAYDALGRLLTETYPDTTQHKYTYDLNGNILQKKTANGHTINYAYDSVNRLIGVKYPLGRQVKYGYDLGGNKTFSQDSDYGSSEFDYNNRNWLRAERKTIANPIGLPVPYLFTYWYNEVGNLTNETYPSGDACTYDVDSIHRIRQALFSPSAGLPYSPIAQYAYNPMGTVASIQFGNGTSQAFAYDSRDRLTRTHVTAAAGSVPFENRYTYDAVGNRSSTREENGRTLTYDYDPLYRLTSVDFGGRGLNRQQPFLYGYDAVGNRTIYLASTTKYSYTYKPNENQLTSVGIDRSGRIDYDWDANGNLLRQNHFNGADKFKQMDFSWDEEDRLKKINFKTIDTAGLIVRGKEAAKDSGLEFLYDDSGARIRKSTTFGGVVKKSTTYLRKGLSVVEEYEGTTNLELKTVYAGGVLKREGGSNYYFYKDALGSTALVLDEAGSNIARYKYDAFGSEEYSEESSTFSEGTRRFTGKEMDGESGLQYFGARYYDPFVGRWTGKDPAKEGNNYYLYCQNNPFRYTDRDGRVIFDGDRISPAEMQLSQENWNRIYNQSLERNKQTETILGATGVLSFLKIAHDVARGKQEKAGGGDFFAAALTFIPVGRVVKGVGGWVFSALKDIDLRGSKVAFQEALDIAFSKTGVAKSEFEVTMWGKTKYGKSIPVEYRAKGGARVSVDLPHEGVGPAEPHLGYQTAGKNATKGHIILDDVPAGRGAKE